MARVFIIRFCRMSISAWNSSRTYRTYSRSVRAASSLRRPLCFSTIRNIRSSFSQKYPFSSSSSSQTISSSWISYWIHSVNSCAVPSFRDRTPGPALQRRQSPANPVLIHNAPPFDSDPRTRAPQRSLLRFRLCANFYAFSRSPRSSFSANKAAAPPVWRNTAVLPFGIFPVCR